MEAGVIVLIFFVIAFGSLGIAWIIMKMKGKLSVKLDKLQFNSGENITGEVILNLKKQVESKGLIVTLRGERVTTTRDKFGNRSTFRDKIIEESQQLEGESKLVAGEKKYKINLAIPKDAVSRMNKGNSMLDNIANTIDAISGRQNNIEWSVEVSLDVPGLDLIKKIRITVN